MGKIIATIPVRDRGVITLPSDLRKKLGIKEGDTITIVLEKKQVYIKKAKIDYEEFDIK